MFGKWKERNSSLFESGTLHERTPSRKCPVTGLPVRSRPEWINIDFGSEYFLTIRTIGPRILLCEPWGKAGATDFLESKERIEKVAQEIFGNSPHVQIEDFSKLRNQKQKIIEHYFEETAKRENLLALIAHGLSFRSLLGFRLKKRLRPPAFDLVLRKNYTEAVNEARCLLPPCDSKRQNGKTREAPAAKRLASPNRQERKASIPKIFSKEEWLLDFGDFDIHYQIIDFEIIYSVSHGFIQAKHLPDISDLRNKVARALVQIGEFNYFIVDMEGLTGMSGKVRRKYLESIQNFYRRYPFIKLYFCSGNKLLNTASNLVRPFLDFELRAVRDLEHALALVSKEKSKSAKSPAGNHYKPNVAREKKGNEKFVQDFMMFLGAIDWEKEGMPEKDEIPPSHPFREVFDAVRLIKREVDSLIEEKRQREKDLIRTVEKANNAKNEFLSNISHELFTPLHAIVNFSRFGIDKMESATREQMLEYFREINKHGLRLTALLEDLVQLRGLESGETEFRCEENNLPDIVDGLLPKIGEKGTHLPADERGPTRISLGALDRY